MRLKRSLKVALIALLVGSAQHSISQVLPTATAAQSDLPFAVGAGGSSFDVDWGHGRMEGGTVWADWGFNRGPAFTHGFGLEAEARDISLGHSSTQPSNFRLDTAGGGVTYTWTKSHRFRPYGKYLISIGRIDWNNPDPLFRHETRTVTAPGIGLEYRILNRVWARADYEYQYWPDIAGKGSEHVLNPQGFSFGIMYNFKNHKRF
jgi:opacity protein-like surface antigen